MHRFFRSIQSKWIKVWGNLKYEFINSPTPYAIVVFLLLNLALFLTLQDFMFRVSAEDLEDSKDTYYHDTYDERNEIIDCNVESEIMRYLIGQDIVQNDTSINDDHFCVQGLLSNPTTLFHKLGQWRWDMNEEYFSNFLNDNRYLIVAKVIVDKNYLEEFAHALFIWIKRNDGRTLQDVSNMDILTFLDEFGDRLKVRNKYVFNLSIVKYDLNDIKDHGAKDICFNYHLHPNQVCNIDSRINRLGWKYRSCFETWNDCKISRDQYYHNTLFGYILEFKDS